MQVPGNTAVLALAVAFFAVAAPLSQALGQDSSAGKAAQGFTTGAAFELPLTTQAQDDAPASLPSPLSDPAERAARIAAHAPAPPNSMLPFIPPNVRARLDLRYGALLERLGLYEAARDATSRAIALGAAPTHAWRRLAILRIHSGETESAEGAFLAAIDAAGPDFRPAGRARLYGELAELYLLLDSPHDALSALDVVSSLAELTPRESLLRTQAAYELTPEDHPAPESVPLLWPAPTQPPWKEAVVPWLAGTPEGVQDLLRSLRSIGVELWLVGAAIMMMATALLLLTQRGRQNGDLLVMLHYPSELTGSFSVRLAKRKGRFKPLGEGAVSSGHRSSKRNERHQVSRETHFTGLRRGEWFVTVEGALTDEASGERIVELFEEHGALVSARQSERIEFDLQPPGCRVEVNIVWDKRPARDATVGVDGSRDSLRYVRGGSVNVRLTKGQHRIAVGSSDRVVEAEIEIDGYVARQLVVDLAGSDAVLFKGCPPAVEPYMHGDVEAAAHALEREGQRACAQAMLARLRSEQGNPRKAAEHFEAAGMAREAAALHESLANHSRAAALLLGAGDALRAAELFSAAGKWAAAGGAYETAGDHANAAACYGEAGDHARWASSLERHGEAFDAGRIALEAGDRAYAIQLFDRVAKGDPMFVDACRELADCYEAEGHHDLAAQRLLDALESGDDEDQAPSLRWRLASMLEESGDFSRALSVLDELRLSCPTYPNVATRIESLRKRQSARDLSPGAQILGSDGGGGGMTPTAFLTDKRYDVQEEIGRGGMGQVFRAHDKRLDRIVALKQLPQTLRDHPRAIELFLREAQSAARLNHPNVVTVYDTDQQDGTFFITMELLEGYPLNAILKRKGVLRVRDALRLGIQVCAGLEYAHSQRIVHRDIKTANLFFTRDRVVKIMDFGLAKMVEEVRRASTIVGGTPYYMAPEQGTGGDIDHRADLYAFGVTLFQLVTGELPFQDGDVTYKHRHVAPPDPREIAPELPTELAELILQMLEKDPDDRPASAAEVGDRLGAMLRNK